jgi:hypothetical protein
MGSYAYSLTPKGQDGCLHPFSKIWGGVISEKNIFPKNNGAI